MFEFVRRFSHLQLLASNTRFDSRQWLKPEDPSDTTFNVIKAIRALQSPGSQLDKFKQLDAELDELLSYLERPLPRDDRKLAIKKFLESTVRELEAGGLGALEILALLPKLTKKMVGRPVTARLDAVVAAEMFDSGVSWTKIAQKLFHCKDPADCFQRRETIRKAVKSLDTLFRKLGIPIPPRKHSSKKPSVKMEVIR
ncbi:MAG: hypothetical protein WBL70_05520 [Candidatus Acidiferrales bacterium]